MIKDCITNLEEHQELLLKLSDKQYQYQSELLSGASIGQHLRHVVEFYDCLLNGLLQEKINYEKRARSLDLENNRKTAINKISSIIDQLLSLESNSRLYLEIEDFIIDTSVQRELYYNLEHSIHHQALIKVGLKEQNIGNMVNADFGVAPSTLKYRKQCVG
jgi:uncharacterized damage-inducible protein DinB